MYTETAAFEWDGRQARRNFRKHGMRFKEAATAFDDPCAIIRLISARPANRQERTHYAFNRFFSIP